MLIHNVRNSLIHVSYWIEVVAKRKFVFTGFVKFWV